MPSTVYYIGTSPNQGVWDLGEITGPQFEDLVAKAVIWHVRDAPEAVQVRQTRRVHDGGKDIIVRASIPIRLFGFNLRRDAKPSYKVYIECKHTSSDRLSGDFRQNLTQFEDEVPDYYILATDSTITPYNQFTAALDCRGKQCHFLLADKYTLYSFLSQTSSTSGNWIGPMPSPLVVEYQTDRDPSRDNREVRLYLAVRNYQDKRVPCDLRLVTDENWTIKEALDWGADERAQFLIEPFETFTTRITAKKEANIGLPDLRITLNVDERPKEIRVNNRDIEFSFLPPFTGTSHWQLITALEALLAAAAKSGSELLFISITGYAGRGKSRIIEELRNRSRSGFILDDVVFFGQRIENETVEKLLDRAGFKSSATTAGDKLTDFLTQFTADFTNRAFIFEDLHHASREIIDCIKKCVGASRPRKNGSLVFILTGRNDFTFPNEDYFSLLELFELRNGDSGIHSFLVPALTDEETTTLIRSTIQHVPEEALRKIFCLSENTPFYIVQVIEYLLDIKLARLVNRNTIGIPEVENFNLKDALPDAIQQIYEARFGALLSAPHGATIRRFLIAASFFGFVVPRLMPEIFLDGLDNEAIYQTLLGRHFLQYRPNGDLTFSHENLLHFLRDYVRREENRRECASIILNEMALFSQLARHERGEVFFLADDIDACVHHLDDIKFAIEGIDNFSSENLDTRYFPYLGCLFEAECQRKATPALLRKILLAEAYMAVHNFAVSRGVDTCRRAREKVRRIPFRARDSRALRSSLQQLEAHGLLNVGRTHSAWRIMLELEATTRLRPDLAVQNPDLIFDLYDRLQELHKKWNHYKLAEVYGTLAEQVADEQGNGKLKACSAITFVGMDLYTNPDKAYRTAERADRLANTHGAYRLGVYTGLSLRLIEAISSRKDRSILGRIREEVRAIAERAATDNLPDSLMRSQLLLATLTYYLAPDDRRARGLAKQYVDAGMNASLKYGNGLFIWLLANLRAIITMAEGGRGNEVDAAFNSARTSLERQSLLFLGNIDVCYPNMFVISNYIRHMAAEHGEKSVYPFIRRLESYQSYDLTSPINEADVLNELLSFKTGVIFKKGKRYAVFIDPFSGYFLPVL